MDAGVAHKFSQARDFGLQKLAELIGCGRLRLCADGCKALVGVGRIKALHNLGVELDDDLARYARGGLRALTAYAS